MGCGPDKDDFEASEAEKASASVAMAEHNWFKHKYDPLLQVMRDQSKSDDDIQTLRGRANADTMQALTGPAQQASAARRAMTGDDGGDVAQAIQGQLGAATTKGKEIQNQMKTNVLGTARGQAADAQSGMAQAANLATSEALTRAKAKQQEKDALFTAAGQLAGATIERGLSNRRTRGTREGPLPESGMGPGAPEEVQGSFWRPVDSQGNRLGFFSKQYI